MRVAPTPTQKGNLDIRSPTNTFLAVTALNPGYTTTQAAELDVTVASGLTGGYATTLESNNDVNGDVWLDAEIP